jgi:SAM-dependent methyltransferase
VTSSGPGEAQLYERVHQLLRSHESLLCDGRRNRPFMRALKKHVNSETHVLDIGSGSGIWAIAAAKLGARRVVAIEREPLMGGVIRELAKANGVSDRVDVLIGDALHGVGSELGKDFDIVITETIGYLGFDEEIVPIAVDARTRFLKPGGAMIPNSLSLCVAGVRVKDRRERLPVGIPLEFDYFESLARHSPHGRDKPTALEFLTAPRVLVHADLTTITGVPDLTNLAAQWPAADVAGIDGFAAWCDMTLTKGVRLSTARTSSWSPVVYRIRGFEQSHGDLEFKLALTAETANWNVSLTGSERQELQTYSPALAAAELLAQARGGPGVFSHYRRLGLMP